MSVTRIGKPASALRNTKKQHKKGNKNQSIEYKTQKKINSAHTV
ncbi:hypothetical protein predicted by Glimmer/Critica [Salmonella enterica subsp. enterica serovar Weltevreden str. 2007-60-3289-1]|nr:hypothetical protein predicted by Glimmer/Critica [Salmonella enterica subsp. enterica serovar Weltevreden str. 2007-60-3289-1]